MMRVISVGKPISGDYKDLIGDFEKRLDKSRGVEWLFLAPSGHDEVTARRVESDAVRSKLADGDFVVLCDERGQELSSEALADKLDGWLVSGRRITFIIGGAFGVDEALRTRADFVWSFSPLVFPHQIVRLLLTEQLYRAQCISAGHPYHHQ